MHSTEIDIFFTVHPFLSVVSSDSGADEDQGGDRGEEGGGEGGPPDAKKPKVSVSFQHPVSELVSKHQGAIFNYTCKPL